ncbi:hypothetical protein M9H77_14632 [Catharanthus roseus]|uniref:Uncharacterized protein n=1 Tax=Catharanthus roseus TaxID=4058 RepID=A0ACC0BNS1_CATRO|nr:hypothetical protein M9H77_14632 [Catharanthus roseus]
MLYIDGNGDNSSEFGGADRLKVAEEVRVGDSSSSTSSIGRNSDTESSAERSSDGGVNEEVQSKFKGGGGALDNLEALEEVLPMKRSISSFYSGKSKSFTSLADAASCSSIKDIVKPENAYTRKRKNLLAYSNFWDKNHITIRRSSSGAISKRHSNSRSTLTLAATMGCAESNNSDSSNSNSPPRGICLPPLPPQVRRSPNNDSISSPPEQMFSPWRSFSLSDLQGAAASPNISGITVNHRQE